MNALPGTVQFIAEVGHKAYELWLASPSEDRRAYQSGSTELTTDELDQAAMEIAQETGVKDQALIDVMVQSIRGIKSLEDDEALQSINATLNTVTHGQATITPQSQAHRRLSPSTVPTELKSVLQKCLHRDKEQRYQSAIEIDQPYREGVEMISTRFAHNDSRYMWDKAERAKVFMDVNSLDHAVDEEWYKFLTDLHSVRISKALDEVSQWRATVLEAEKRALELESAFNDLEVSHVERSSEVARTALSMSEDVETQWDTWHKGLCALERAREIRRAEVKGAKFRVRGRAELRSRLHQSLTAWGRANYRDREDAERAARQALSDQRDVIERKAQELEDRGQSISVGVS